MANNDKAANAARNCQSNDIEDFDDYVDFLSEKILAIVRILISDESLRILVLGDAFSKCFFEDAYTGEPFDDIELAKDIVGERLAGHIIDNDPMLYTDFCGVCGDDDPDDETGKQHPGSECDCNLCGGDCDICPYRDAIVRYVYDDGLVRRICVGRDSDA